MNEQTYCLGVFAKLWAPGRVKTRLATTIGPGRAAEVYRAFVETSLARFSALPAVHTLVYDGADAEQAFAGAAPQWKLRQQAAGDLGERMEAFFEEQFAAGFRKIVLLGTDSPNLPLSFIERAFQELDEQSCVFGPSDDGGYYLIGAAGASPPVFGDIPWSTPQVWQATQRALDACGRLYATLPTWYDVDEAIDLERLLADLRAESFLDLPLETLLGRLEQILGS